MTTTSTAPVITDTQAVQEARWALAVARRTLATMLAAPTPATARARAASVRRIEDQEGVRDMARANLERAVRAANPGQPEAAIQAATRAL